MREGRWGRGRGCGPAGCGAVQGEWYVQQLKDDLPSTPGRKSCPITCAKRLGEFLGDERIKDKGLNCKWVVSKRPDNLPTSERAIPVSIFSAEPAVSRAYLRKWCGDLGCSGGEGVEEGEGDRLWRRGANLGWAGMGASQAPYRDRR